MLQIKNLNKIVGQHLYTKWLPKTEGWAVRAVEEIGDTYIFELINTQNGTWRQAEIQLRREKNFDPNDFTIKWELWAWNLENNKPERMMCKSSQMNTISEMGLRLAMILERILPTIK
jgi:hypothetical protein